MLLASSPAFAQKHKPKKAPAAAPATKPPPKKAPPPPDTDAEQPPPDESKASDESKPPEESSESPPDQDRDHATPSHGKAPKVKARLLELSLGFDWFTRHLSYAGDTLNTLPPYELSGAPAVSLGAEVYPLREGDWSVGVAGSAGFGFVNSKAANGSTSYRSQANQFSIGARGRYHFLQTSWVGAGFDFGSQNYSVDDPPPTITNAGIPDMAYRFLRPSVEARIDVIKSLAVLGRAGYLIVLSSGQIESDAWFVDSRTSVSGLDLGVTVAYEVYPHFEIRPAFDFRRYAYSFQPLPTDQRIASTARDTYLSFSLGVGYWM